MQRFKKFIEKIIFCLLVFGILALIIGIILVPVFEEFIPTDDPEFVKEWPKTFDN